MPVHLTSERIIQSPTSHHTNQEPLMRYLLALTLAILPTTCLAQWGHSGGRSANWGPRPYVQMPQANMQIGRLQPLHPVPGYSSQTVYLPNATFYQDSYGNSGMSVWSGNARFDSFNQVRPIPRTNWWGW